VQLHTGSITDLLSLRAAVVGVDFVFHLAGMTKSLRKQSLWDVNESGSRNIAQVCAEVETPPTLIAVSSLAAGGPVVPLQIGETVPAGQSAQGYRIRRETDVPQPVSNYGRSKLAGEQAILEFAGTVPISIVRPPIVLGPADRDGLEMFRLVAHRGVHLVPGWGTSLFSVIHVDDLASTLSAVALHGERCQVSAESAQGIYFTGDPQIVSYADLGKMIGEAIGAKFVRCVRVPPRIVRAVALVNQGISYLRGQPHILGIDKSREATARGWACDSARLQRDCAVTFPINLQSRLHQTADWYRASGWL
jgi:nucleoside-diphosphate-sugar epimerase